MSKCKLLSLDTSSTDSGWAYFENGILEDYGHIEMNKKDDSIIKQEKMIIALKELVDRIDPDICVIETPPYMNSPKTLILLAEIVGSVRGMVIDRCQYEEMEPKRWRRLVAMVLFRKLIEPSFFILNGAISAGFLMEEAFY